MAEKLYVVQDLEVLRERVEAKIIEAGKAAAEFILAEIKSREVPDEAEQGDTAEDENA